MTDILNEIALPVLNWFYEHAIINKIFFELCHTSLLQLYNEKAQSIDIEELILQGAKFVMSWLPSIPIDILQASFFITHRQKTIGQEYPKNPHTYIRDINTYVQQKLQTIITTERGSRLQFVQNLDISRDLAHLHEVHQERRAKQYLREICTSLISFWKYGKSGSGYNSNNNDDEMTKVFSCLTEWKIFALNEPDVSLVFDEDCSSSQELHRHFLSKNSNNILSLVQIIKQVIMHITSYSSIESMKFWYFWLSQLLTLDDDLSGLTNENVYEYRDILANIFNNWGRFLSQMDLKFLGCGNSSDDVVVVPIKLTVDNNIPTPEVISMAHKFLTQLKDDKDALSKNKFGEHVLDLVRVIVNDVKIEEVEKFYGKMFNEQYARLIHAKMLIQWKKNINNNIDWEDFFNYFSTYARDIIHCLDPTFPSNNFWVFLIRYLGDGEKTLEQLFCDVDMLLDHVQNYTVTTKLQNQSEEGDSRKRKNNSVPRQEKRMKL